MPSAVLDVRLYFVHLYGCHHPQLTGTKEIVRGDKVRLTLAAREEPEEIES